MRNKKSTLADVAAHAGVSQATVSRLLNGYTNICTPETARRIYAAIDLVGYIPRRSQRRRKEDAAEKEHQDLVPPSDDDGIGTEE